MSIGLAIGTHLGRVGGAGNTITYLLGPFFRPGVTPDQAAPLPSPYTEAGAVGSLTVLDTGNKASVSGGRFAVAAGGTNNDPRLTATSFTGRTVGRAFLGKHTAANAGVSDVLGFSSSAVSLVNSLILYLSGTTLYGVDNDGPAFTLGASFAAGVEYDLAVVIRSAGGFLLVRGGAYTSWTLLAVLTANTAATLYPQIRSGGGIAAQFSSLRVTDLGGAFATDYGIATSRLVSPAANTDSTSAADAVTEINFTYNGTPLYFQYRRQDANNTWEIDAASGTLTLYEVNGGTYTSRGSSASTFAATTAYRIVVVYAGTSHTVYVNNTQKFAVTSASFQTQTAIRLDAGASGGVSSIVAWPRTVSLPNV